MLRAVVFDAGGTLVRLDFEWMREMLGALGVPVSLDDLRRAEVNGRRRYDSLATRPRPLPPGQPHPPLGSIAPTTAYFSGLLEGVGCRHPVLEEALARIDARRHGPELLWGRRQEGAREALDGMAALGLRSACVSNSDGRAEQHLVECGVRDGLEFVLDSQLEGIEKPDPEIFRRALRRLEVAPEESVYVGDILSVDARGAAAAGMHFALVDPFGDYGGPAIPAITTIAELPGFLAERYVLPQGRP